MKIKRVPIFILMDKEGNVIIAVDTLNEAKQCKDFIKNNFDTTNNKVLIREKIINKPDEGIIKRSNNKYVFVIENKKGDKFAKFDSLNEAKMFLKRLIDSFGEPNEPLSVRQIIPNKTFQGPQR